MNIKSSSIEAITDLTRKAHDYNLLKHEIIYQFSMDELLKIYNGLGPKSFPSWLRSFLSGKYDELLPAVLIHDLEFHLGGDEKQFHSANKRLKQNCLICVEHSTKHQPLKRIYFTIKACIFYKLCEVFGFKGWSTAQTTCCF